MKNKTNGHKYTQWTADDIKKVITVWQTKTTKELAVELNKTTEEVNYIAAQIRKSGYDLPRKRKKGYIQPLIVSVISKLKKK
jgi:hypothetical protein